MKMYQELLGLSGPSGHVCQVDVIQFVSEPVSHCGDQTEATWVALGSLC